MLSGGASNGRAARGGTTTKSTSVATQAIKAVVAPTASLKGPTTPAVAGETNIFVAVRVRPKTSAELARGVGHTVELLNDASTLIFDTSDGSDSSHRSKNQAFQFDCVLGPECSQETVYSRTAKDIIPSLLDGFNCSVFAYGQTSAGKTFTMLGNRMSGEGVMVRALKDLFETLAAEERKRASSLVSKDGGRTVEYALTFSYVEVYNESIRDLLAESKDSKDLDLRDSPDGDVSVVGVSEHKPTNVGDVMSLLERGNSNRSQSATDANETSSRSHAILQVHVRRTERKTVAGKVKTMIRRSKLSMVDLAGSERAKATVEREMSLRKEGQNINLSLLALGNCISALAAGSSHVPYRESKLTRLLKDSLGGNCRTIMIANISPCFSNYEDTYSTLNYAKRAKNIRVTLSKAQIAVATSSDNFNLAQIEALREENERLRQLLRSGAAPTSTDVQVTALHTAKEAEVDGSVLEGLRAIQAEAESLFTRKVNLHRRVFAAWVQGQWTRLRSDHLKQELEKCHDLVRLDSLRAEYAASQSHAQSYAFDMESMRKQMHAVEQEISALRDEHGQMWAVFRGGSERIKELKKTAILYVEFQEGRCEAEMMKRECNILRTMVEKGWEIDDEGDGPAQGFANMTSPQMTTGTPIWKKLSKGSPGLKMPVAGRRKLDLDQEDPVAFQVSARAMSALTSGASFGTMASTAQPGLVTHAMETQHEKMPEKEQGEYDDEPDKEGFEPIYQPPPSLFVVQPVPPSVSAAQKPSQRAVAAPPSKSYSFFDESVPDIRSSGVSLSVDDVPSLTGPDAFGLSSVLRTIDDAALNESAAPQQIRLSDVSSSRLDSSRSKKGDMSINSDDVPVYVRSFGSALSMLGTALLKEPNTSGSTQASPTTSTSAPSNSAPLFAPPFNSLASTTISAPVRKSNVRERLQRMVKERVAAKKEEDVEHRVGGGVSVEELAFSPVEGAKPRGESEGADFSALPQVSFALSTSPAPLSTKEAPLLSPMEYAPPAASTRLSKIPKPKTKPKGTTDMRIEEENVVNNASSTIPKAQGGSNRRRQGALTQVL